MYLLCCIQSCITSIMEKAPLGSPPLLWQWFCCSSGPSDWGQRGGGQGGQSPPPDFGWNRGKPVPLNPFIYLIAPQIFRRSYNPTVASDHDCALKCLRVPYWFHRSLESSWDKLHFGELEEFLKVFSLMICEASTKKAIPWIDDWLLKSA